MTAACKRCTRDLLHEAAEKLRQPSGVAEVVNPIADFLGHGDKPRRGLVEQARELADTITAKSQTWSLPVTEWRLLDLAVAALAAWSDPSTGNTRDLSNALHELERLETK